MRVLVVKLSSLGDLFNAMPAVQLVRRHLGATIDWVTQPEYLSLLRLVEGVERVIPYPRQNFFVALPAFRSELRQSPYDLILDFQGLLKSALVARIANGARRISPSFSRECSSLFMGEKASPATDDPSRHALEECLDTPRYLALPVDQIEWGIRFPPMDIFPSPLRIALAPFSRWPAKNWPLDRFRDLATALLRKTQATLHLIGGKADQPSCAALAETLGPRVFNHAGTTDLPATGSLLAQMNLLVTNDSGPMHMACAIRTPVLALFGPTDARRTGPYGKQHTVLQSPLFTPRDIRQSAYKSGDLKWMNAISVRDVLDTALAMLSQSATTPS